MQDATEVAADGDAVTLLRDLAERLDRLGEGVLQRPERAVLELRPLLLVVEVDPVDDGQETDRKDGPAPGEGVVDERLAPSSLRVKFGMRSMSRRKAPAFSR